jgi:Zn-dependent peptidase ImmA (M78 family)
MDIKSIRDLAEEIAKKYNPEGLAPFPFERILEDHKDLQIFTSNKLPQDLSGAINFNEKSKFFEILINKNKSVTRQHFTSAHEVGHYFLHKETIQYHQVLVDGEVLVDENFELHRSDTPELSQVEKEANNFAASLIMPNDLTIQLWETFHDIEECAHIFVVSPIAMTIRLESLGLLT